MITFHKHQLRAALQCAATKDVRYYMVGVHIECAHDGRIHIVSTDGHMLFVGLIRPTGAQWTGEPQKGPWRMTIPTDVVKRETKGKGDVTLKTLGDAYQLGDTVFAPVDGQFPNWRRVIGVSGSTGEPVPVNPSLLMSAQTAVALWANSTKPEAVTFVEHYADDKKLRIVGDGADCFAIVMGLRHTRDQYTRVVFTPTTYEATP